MSNLSCSISVLQCAHCKKPFQLHAFPIQGKAFLLYPNYHGCVYVSTSGGNFGLNVEYLRNYTFHHENGSSVSYAYSWSSNHRILKEFEVRPRIERNDNGQIEGVYSGGSGGGGHTTIQPWSYAQELDKTCMSDNLMHGGLHHWILK